MMADLGEIYGVFGIETVEFKAVLETADFFCRAGVNDPTGILAPETLDPVSALFERIAQGGGKSNLLRLIPGIRKPVRAFMQMAEIVADAQRVGQRGDMAEVRHHLITRLEEFLDVWSRGILASRKTSLFESAA